MHRTRTWAIVVATISLMLLAVGCGEQPPNQAAQVVVATPIVASTATVNPNQYPTPIPTDTIDHDLPPTHEPELPLSEATLTFEREDFETSVAMPSPTPLPTPIPYIIAAGETLTATNGVISFNRGGEYALIASVGISFQIVTEGWYEGITYEGQYENMNKATVEHRPTGCVRITCQYSILKFTATKRGTIHLMFDHIVGCYLNQISPCPTQLPGLPTMDFTVMVR